MDNSSSGKRPGKLKPFNFTPPKPVSNRFELFVPIQQLSVSDGLQPGTLPSQFLGQFTPYGSGIVNAPNVHNNRNPMPFHPSAQTTSPDLMPTSDSSNMSTSSSSTSLSTHEHFIRTYSQESVGKLKIEPNTEVRKYGTTIESVQMCCYC